MDPIFIQFLSSLPVLNYFADFYHQVISEADTRTQSWALMSSPDVPVSIVLVYLITVAVLGPFFVRRMAIPGVNKMLVIYNSFVLTLNLWLGILLTWHISKAGYQLGCQKVAKIGSSPHEDSIASLLWIFHSSKIIELVDTLFLVIKRKEKQLTFLHLYHHSTIVVATWIGVKFVPGGSSAVIAMVNSWIHVFMYFYYEMMVLRVKAFRNYKKIVTILQIVQFLATIVLCTTALKRDCGYPSWILTWLLLYMISFLVLFIHFYIQTYWKPKKESTPGTSSDNDTSSTSTNASNNEEVVDSKTTIVVDGNDILSQEAGTSVQRRRRGSHIDSTFSEEEDEDDEEEVSQGDDEDEEGQDREENDSKEEDVCGSSTTVDFDILQWECLDPLEGELSSEEEEELSRPP